MEVKLETKNKLIQGLIPGLIKKLETSGQFGVQEEDLLRIYDGSQGEILFKLTMMLAATVPGATKLKFPLSPWQYFKDRYFPRWAKRRWKRCRPRLNVYDAVILLPKLWIKHGYPKDWLEKNEHRCFFLPLGEHYWIEKEEKCRLK